jgi:hypothetical protein
MSSMIYRLYGMAAGMVLVLGLAAYSTADRAMNYKAAKASVSYIDRTCDFIETTSEAGVKTSHATTDSCNSTDEWDRVRDAIREKRRKKISGSETVHLTYTAPQDGSYRTAELHFDGGDDEFYELQAGDEVSILVSNSNLTKIRKA